MAKAIKLPSGNWRVQASITVNGAYIRKSFTANNKKTAEAEAKMWQAGMLADKNTENITLGNCYDRFIESKSNVLSPSTLKGYKQLRNNHLKDIMPLNINSLTNEAIQRSINLYASNHSPKSTRNCYGLLSAVFKMFRPEFTLHIKLPQKKAVPISIPENEDIKKIIKVAKNTRCYIPILLSAFGSMRRGEICALTSDDLNGNLITVNKSLVLTPENEWVTKSPKTFASNRVVELPDFVANEIKGIQGKLVDYNPQSLTIAFNRLLKKNNLPHFRFHDLRHYYVSSLHAINIPDKYIQAQGGWSTNHTMNRVYNHILSSQQSEFSNKITAHFNTIADK